MRGRGAKPKGEGPLWASPLRKAVREEEEGEVAERRYVGRRKEGGKAA